MAVRNRARGLTAGASVRGVNAVGGRPGREFSGGVVTSLSVVRSMLSRHVRLVTIPARALAMSAQSAAAGIESTRVKGTTASTARTKDRMAILHGGPTPAQDTAPASSGKSRQRSFTCGWRHRSNLLLPNNEGVGAIAVVARHHSSTR